jgi:hypothetical protein
MILQKDMGWGPSGWRGVDRLSLCLIPKNGVPTSELKDFVIILSTTLSQSRQNAYYACNIISKIELICNL